MDASSRWTRRRFLHTAALAAASMPLAGPSASAAESPPPAQGKIRVGCLSWCFHDLSPAVDPEPAIDVIGGLGFDGLEMIVTARRDLKDFWTDERIDRLRKKLGAPMLNIVSPWARELTGPTAYLPRYFEVDSPKPGEKFHIDIAPGFDWDRVWAAYVDTTRACLERAKAHGLKFSIEQHTHCLIPDAASFRGLWDAIRDPDLGYNMDAGWTMLQREYPPVAIHKVRRQLMNLHMRDIDGPMRRFVLAGEGVMDFKAVVDTLKTVGFTGFASLEQDRYPGDMKETCRTYLRMMREYIG